ncbi:hypothetical protein EJK15_13110 [Nonomuraea basaltis]|nr:hypothetical protein EJK15_13110 [Nonomuraea basaltis]
MGGWSGSRASAFRPATATFPYGCASGCPTNSLLPLNATDQPNSPSPPGTRRSSAALFHDTMRTPPPYGAPMASLPSADPASENPNACLPPCVTVLIGFLAGLSSCT